jgi:exonuclease VII small subunit
MKIYPDDLNLDHLYSGQKTKPQPAVDNAFNDILKENIENSPKEFTGPCRTAMVKPLNGVQFIAPPKFDKQFALDQLENLIGLLDQYRHELADPQMPLKKLDPIIRKINQESENLAPALDALPDGEALKNIINLTLVTATLEVTKFDRGDYIAP